MDEFPLSPVVARSAIQDTIDFCRPLASISEVEVVADCGEDKMHDYQVVSNVLRLQQVLINLVLNAIKYSYEQSQIRISIQPTVMADVELKIQRALASSRDSSSIANTDAPIKKEIPSNSPVLCFSISDSGSGIAPLQADRLFRRFARLDNEPIRALGGSNQIGQPSGTGLGLNLCELFLHRMNGEIWATNNSDGMGSTFSFYLPLAAESIVDSPIAAPSSKAKQRHSFQELAVDTALMRVLLVDDVLINRKVIGRMVKLVGVSDIVTVDSGPNALREISENGPYDLIITDLQMPGMSGTELCEAIMSDESSPDIRQPVIVGLTANTSVKLAETCRASGMSTIFYKPISVIEMREFFATTLMRLQPGVWYAGRENGVILSAQ
jgi:CheY-like chemotaxis protein